MTTSGNGPEDELAGPPQRLIEDSASSSQLRHDLENAASAHAHYDAAAGLLALQAALGTGAKVAAGASATGAAAKTSAWAAKGALGLKLAIASGVGAVAITSAVYLNATPARPKPEARPPAALDVPRQPARPADKPAPHVPQPPSTPVVDPVAPDAPALDALSNLEPVPHRKALVSSGAPRDRAGAEIAQLAQIKAALERSPRRALRLAEQGNRQFGEGYLHHEREGLAILALAALDRDQEARARAKTFLARYPHSPLSERVRALLTPQARSTP